MIKFFQALLTGMFFTFILDFFLFLGIFLHYTEHYGIGIYYNVLFADNQSLWLFLLFTALLGWLTTYYGRIRQVALILAGLFGVVLLTLIQPIGESVGSALFMEKDQHIVSGRYVYRGDVYYRGRDALHIFDDEAGRIVAIPNEKIQQQ